MFHMLSIHSFHNRNFEIFLMFVDPLSVIVCTEAQKWREHLEALYSFYFIFFHCHCAKLCALTLWAWSQWIDIFFKHAVTSMQKIHDGKTGSLMPPSMFDAWYRVEFRLNHKWALLLLVKVESTSLFPTCKKARCNTAGLRHKGHCILSGDIGDIDCTRNLRAKVYYKDINVAVIEEWGQVTYLLLTSYS